MTKKILIVDDSAIVRRQVAWALVQADYEVVEAADGERGLEAASAHELSLIICDVNMPVIDGLTMLEKLKAKNSTCPVVMLTSEGQPELVSQAKALGAKGWMIKPVAGEHLVAVVRKLTEK